MKAPADVSVDMEVPFHDVDALRIVWHGHYLKYMEIARTALLRSKGIDAPLLEALGVVLLVAESKVRHTFPLRFAERFRVSAWFSDVDHRVRVQCPVRIRGLAGPPRGDRGQWAAVPRDAVD